MKPVRLLLLCAFIGTSFAQTVEPQWNVGLAAVKITPQEPVLLAGYAARTNLSTGIDLDLWAKALALKDANGNRAILITLDLCTFPVSVSDRIMTGLKKETGVSREQIILALSHTHSGPRLIPDDEATAGASAEESRANRNYTAFLEQSVIRAGTQAVARMQTAKLSWGSGVADFAMNRRQFTTNGVILGVNPSGLVDRTVPVLRIDGPGGQLMAVLFGYACHGTTLPPNYLRVSGDFAGYAQQYLQGKHTNVQAMFMMGLGGDANPYQRPGIELAPKHGRVLADEVSRILETKLKPISPSLHTAYDRAEYPLETPAREELQRLATNAPSWQKPIVSSLLNQMEQGAPVERSYKAPIEVWQFGNELTLVSLSNEVVSDYVPLLQKTIGPLNLWLSAYGNEVIGYIPSRRVLEEGGYEARGLYSGRWFAPGVEPALVQTTRSLAAQAGRTLPLK